MRTLSIVVLMILAAACTPLKPMALSDDNEKLRTDTDSLVLFTLKTANDYQRLFQPRLRTLSLSLRQNGDRAGAPLVFSTGSPHREELDGTLNYLISLRLPPGNYRLETAAGTSTDDVFVAAFSIPLHRDFAVPMNRIIYLGHIAATNRERTTIDQTPAGAALPAAEQQAAGFADGTFEITISDRYRPDLAEFSTRFPALVGQVVVNLADALRAEVNDGKNAALRH